MKLLPAIGLTAVGIFLLSKLSAAGVASRLNLLISNFQISTAGIQPVVMLQVMAQNVTNETLQFNALTANAFLNSTFIGNVSGFTPVLIPALGQVPIPLQVLINITAIASDVIAMLSGSAGVQVVLEVKGTANLSNLLIPVNLTYTGL